MKFKAIYFVTIVSATLFGCAAASMYQPPTDPNASATLHFERHVDDPLLGSTTVFVHVRDEFKCKIGQGFLGEQKLATLDRGNPLVSNKNADGIRVQAKDNFRVLVRNVAGLNWCDTVLGFKTEAGKEYKIISTADVSDRYSKSCSVEVLQLENVADNQPTYQKIPLNEYQDCQKP